MTSTIETGQDVVLTGKSGEQYNGKIYDDKNCQSAMSGMTIACLSNSTFTENGWQHQVNSIYNTQNIQEELKHYQTRDDISHLILLSYADNANGVTDKVDDLIRNYIHS